jgi:hypothetical protein
MFALTRQEKILIVCLMCSLLLGAAVKHWRELRRETKRAASAVTSAQDRSATPRER